MGGQTVYIVYADILFFINFCIDFICLYLSAKLCACPAGIARTALGSALGGLYAVAALALDALPPRPSCRCICWRRSSSALRPSSAATGKRRCSAAGCSSPPTR